MAVRADFPVALPEIGSSLGKLAVPGRDDPAELDDIREGLLQRVLQLADESYNFV